MISSIERVIVATQSLGEARRRWERAGFAFAGGEVRLDAMRFQRFAAGAVEVDLCDAAEGGGALAASVRDAASRGGGICGWVWGTTDEQADSGETIELPSAQGVVGARAFPSRLEGVWTAAVDVTTSAEERCLGLRAEFGENPNTVDYLEHIVVMAPVLDDAIAAQESIGVPCRRVREAGSGMRQAFFKLEQTVIEIVGPAGGRPGCWGLAFMCSDVKRAVEHARANGLQATEPRQAVQGGLITRLVESLDGVAVAFMQAR